MTAHAIWRGNCDVTTSVFPNFKHYLRRIEASHRKTVFTIINMFLCWIKQTYQWKSPLENNDSKIFIASKSLFNLTKWYIRRILPRLLLSVPTNFTYIYFCLAPFLCIVTWGGYENKLLCVQRKKEIGNRKCCCNCILRLHWKRQQIGWRSEESMQK